MIDCCKSDHVVDFMTKAFFICVEDDDYYLDDGEEDMISSTNTASDSVSRLNRFSMYEHDYTTMYAFD